MSCSWNGPDVPERDRVVMRLLSLPPAAERVARYLDCTHSYVCERAADLEVDNEMLMNANNRLMRERDEARRACARHEARIEELDGLIERPRRSVGLPGRVRRIARYLRTDDVFTTFVVYFVLLLTVAAVVVEVMR